MSAALPVHQRSFVFEVTRKCHHACPHCYNVWKAADYPDGELSTVRTLDLLGRMLDQTQATLVTLSGGEPLLRSDLVEIVDFLTGRGVGMNLVTNGTLLEESVIDRIGPERIQIFELPLLSAIPEVHDEMSGLTGAFNLVTRAIADLKLKKARVVVVFVATRKNLKQFRETAELAIILGVDGMMFNRFNPGGEGMKHIEALQAFPAELQEALDEAEAFSESFDFPIGCSIAMPPCLIDTGRYRRLTFGFCGAGTDRAYYTLDPVGNVRPCNHSPTILGNLLENSFAELIQGPIMRNFLDARPGFCSGCRLENECMGGCKAAAEVCCGSPWKSDPFLSANKAQARKIP